MKYIKVVCSKSAWCVCMCALCINFTATQQTCMPTLKIHTRIYNQPGERRVEIKDIHIGRVRHTRSPITHACSLHITHITGHIVNGYLFTDFPWTHCSSFSVCKFGNHFSSPTRYRTMDLLSNALFLFKFSSSLSKCFCTNYSFCRLSIFTIIAHVCV